MPIEKVNNVFEPSSKNGNKPVSKPAVYTPIAETAGEDTFYSRHKTAVITGGVIAGIIALGAAAKKGLLGESIQGFINKIFGGASAVPSEKINTPPVSQRTETIIEDTSASMQKVNPETAERISNNTQITPSAPDERLMENADDIVQNAVPDVQKLNSETNSLQPAAKNTVTKNPDEISPVQTESSDLSAAAQAESAVSKIEETAPLKVKEVLCDLSDKNSDFNTKFDILFDGTDEKITFVLPESTDKHQHNGGIYSDLKYTYGESWKNGAIRELYAGVMTCEQESYAGFIKRLDEGLTHGKFRLKDWDKFLLESILDKEADQNTAQKAACLIFRFDDGMSQDEKNAGIALLKKIKENMSFDTYITKEKEAFLEDVENIYTKINETITPLSETSHAYRGVKRDANCFIKGYGDFLDNLKEGEIVTPDAGAMFVTGYPQGAIQYAQKDGFLFHIIIPKGVKMEEAHFRESLMPPMSKYKVLANRQVGSNGFRVIDLEYLADQGTRSFPQ